MELNVFDKQKKHQKRMQENKLSHHTTKIHQEHKTDNSHIVTCCSTAYIAKTEGKEYSHAIDSMLDRKDITKIHQKIGKQHAIRKENYHDYTLPSVKKPKRTTHREFNKKEISEITFTTLPRIPVPDRKGKQHRLESVHGNGMTIRNNSRRDIFKLIIYLPKENHFCRIDCKSTYNQIFFLLSGYTNFSTNIGIDIKSLKIKPVGP